MAPMPHCPPESGVQRLNRIGGVNNLADLSREREKRGELVPSVLPRPDHCRTLLGPLVTERFQQIRSSSDRGGGVDRPHRFGDLRPVWLFICETFFRSTTFDVPVRVFRLRRGEKDGPRCCGTRGGTPPKRPDREPATEALD